MVRTRFAPSPTGFMHLGNLRTGLYTYLYARKMGGTFILRIEDTDQERQVEGATEAIYTGLRLAGITWDEGPDVGGPVGPYIQSERRKLYAQYAFELVEKGGAYVCFCTNDELEERRSACEAQGQTFKYDKKCLHLDKEEVARRMADEPFVIRQNTPTQGMASFDDAIFGHIEVPCDTLDDMVLLKSDGLPTYNFANVVDDHLMGITHVLRGSEYLSSTPKYNLLYEHFGWQKPEYVHLPLILADGGARKLSKRKGDPSFEDLLDQGYLPQAVVNYIALLGWSPGDDREFFTLQELCQAFSLRGLSKSPSVFDGEKLRWFNANYIRHLSPEAYANAALPYLQNTAFAALSCDKQALLLELFQPRTEILPDVLRLMAPFEEMVEDFPLELYENKKMKTDAVVAKTALAIAQNVLQNNSFERQSLHDELIAAAAAASLKNGQLLWPLRVALSGRESTAGGAMELCFVLGKEETLRRLGLSMARF